MKRREFLKVAGAGMAGSAVAAPAIAQSMPEIKWRLTASWPKSLDTLFGACETFSKYVSEATDNKFQVQAFAAGEIVPGLQVLDAVQNGTVEIGHTAVYYFIGKDPTWALFCAVPFGLNTRQQNAWFYDGDGMKLMNEFGKKYNLYALVAGNTGAQMGGWFRKEIKTVDDLKGLKFRIGGLAGRTLQKLGVVPQQIAGGDIYPALEKGTIDAAEWVGPYDDEKLGFYKVAKHYYYPAWWEGGTELDMLVNVKAWEALPKDYQAILEAACADSHDWVLTKYDASNPAALKRLVANGVKLQPFSNDIMAACYKASQEVYDAIAEKNTKFRKVYEPWKRFRDEQVQWFSIAESRYDNFMISAQRVSQSAAAKKK
jgi:TRAP-type mannitol/chloroaromatic compound transport system substrate-binding protein